MCPSGPTDVELVAYLKDPFHGAGTEGIADHLDRCPDCDERAERLRSGLGPLEPPAELIDKILLLGFPTKPIPEDQKPQIGGYEILGEIGRGGMGVVYKAWHAKHGTIALKVLLREALATPADVEQARREAREAQAAWQQAVAAGDQHPPYIQVYEVGESDDGIHFISMELAAAGTLEDRIPDLIGNPDIAAGFLRIVSLAVHAMHHRGVVHRDLTPRNILLRLKPGRPIPLDPRNAPLQDLDPVVSDYGLAKRMDAPGQALSEAVKTSPGVLKGTLPYMAPERMALG